MKKILFVGITALAMASCTHDDYAPVSKQEQYQAVFEKEFGAVNPNVNWGFTPQQVFTFDKDGKLIGTRGANTNANQWYEYLTVPAALTDAQKEVVRKWFQNNPNPKGLEVNWSDFFVQQVYKGGTNTEGSQSPEKYDILKDGVPDKDKGKVTGSDHMDWLACGNEESQYRDHINNFNGGDAGIMNVGEGDNKFHNDKIMYMHDYNTTCFGFHDSYGQTYYYDSYVLIPGDIIDPIVAGMYFVGFDYKMQKSDNGELKVEADGYYSDWIVRVVPGLNAPGAGKRVMVEDIIDSNLASVQTSDWDFNDAVFDVRFEESWVNGTPENNYQDAHNQKYAIITLHAAGGTKYLTIGGQGTNGKEVHEALGVEIGTMVNTGNGATRPVAIFRIPVADNVNNANDIPVYVGAQILEAKQGQATQKLCVPTDVKWMKERVQFINSYDQFKDYVNNSKPEDWYKRVQNLGNLY